MSTPQEQRKRQCPDCGGEHFIRYSAVGWRNLFLCADCGTPYPTNCGCYGFYCEHSPLSSQCDDRFAPTPEREEQSLDQLDMLIYCSRIATGAVHTCGKHEQHNTGGILYHPPAYREHAFDCTVTDVAEFDYMRMTFGKLFLGEIPPIHPTPRTLPQNRDVELWIDPPTN